ncbi:MAG: 23S rRNA (adenine(2503)-C(2))-methyltransferase RlmN [Desulfobulbaceae bacterium]|nr:23S rRNA (adenine(2503)-C(2))-methyltransferase RlmN [Desulfobulbaceae bacterium]
MKIDLQNLTLQQMADFFEKIGIPPERSAHVFNWLFQPGNSQISEMRILRREIRELLHKKAFVRRLESYQTEVSGDGTVKFVFLLDDGAQIESVLIPGPKRYTLCVSSQVGCAMGCHFCLTGGMGFIRNLEPFEIVGQVLAVMEYMVQNGVIRSTPRELINNLVFMGMGEPLANFDHLLTTLDILMDSKGLEFTERRITVSTCGIVPRINDLGQSVRVNLAISLHAADDTTRSQLMPVNRTYPIAMLLQACRDYPLAPGKVILIEYILFQGLNDSEAAALLLVKQLRGIPCRINLMPFNQSEKLPYTCPDQRTIKTFQAILRQAGFTTLIRNSRGADISAACGQLASQGR